MAPPTHSDKPDPPEAPLYKPIARNLVGNPTLPLQGAGAAAWPRNREYPSPKVSVVTNEASLLSNLTGDTLAALGASAGMVPFIIIADRAIIQVTLGRS